LRRIHDPTRLVAGETRAQLALICGIVSTAFMVGGIVRFLVAGGVL
jgi:hypothetical protein